MITFEPFIDPETGNEHCIARDEEGCIVAMYAHSVAFMLAINAEYDISDTFGV